MWTELRDFCVDVDTSRYLRQDTSTWPSRYHFGSAGQIWSLSHCVLSLIEMREFQFKVEQLGLSAVCNVTQHLAGAVP